MLPTLRSIVVLGGFGWAALWPAARAAGLDVPARPPRFGHGVTVDLGAVAVFGCYHVSQQNTFTGRLTEPMLDAVLAAASAHAANRTGPRPALTRLEGDSTLGGS
jgi:uracil-DNA glycosylase